MLSPFLESFVDDEIRRAFAELPMRVNDLGYDPWGFHPEEAQLLYSIGKRVFQYFRPEISGIENIPEGRVLIVPNHSGQLPLDGIVVGIACLLMAKPPRLVRAMAERWFPTLPVVNEAFSRSGVVVGDPINCRNLLLDDNAILVFPEGTRGSGKVWKNRYQLARFGRGFMRLALQTNAPIVPVSVVGAEESIISVYDAAGLAKKLGMPYMPISPLLPLLGPLAYLPLPTKFYVDFGEPMHFEGPFDDEDSTIDEKVAAVQGKVQSMIDTRLATRPSIFLSDKTHMATLLVTGIAGGLSQRVATMLRAEGHTVVGVDYRSLDREPREGEPLAGMKIYRANYNKTFIEDVFRYHSFDSVLHLGRVGNLKESVGKRFDLNVVGSQKIMNLCVQYKVKKVVVLSTFHIYGAHPANHTPIHEDEPLRAGLDFPQLADAIQLDNMATTWVYKFDDVQTVVLRPTNVVGPTIHNAMSNFLRQTRVPHLFGFNPMMQFVHEDDLARAIVLAGLGESRGIYNVGGPAILPFRTAIELAGATTYPLPSSAASLYVNLFSRTPAYLLNFFKYPCVISDDAFRKTYRYAPDVDIRTTIASTVKEARDRARQG